MNTIDLSEIPTDELNRMIADLEQKLSSPEGTGVDKTQGADFVTRAGASFKSDPTERLSFVKKRLGPDNVATTANGEIVWRKPGDKKWRAFDESGLSLSDVADFIGDVPEIVGGALGATAGAAGGALTGPGAIAAVPAGGVAGAAAGSAAGNVVKQAISALLPGEESVRLVDRAKDVALAGAFGGVGQKLGNAVARGLSPSVRAALPENVYAQEGARLESAIGGKLTAGQRSGSEALRVTEDYLRRNPAAAGVMGDFEVEKQIKPIRAYLERTMDRLASTEVGDAALGESVRTAFDRAARTLSDQTLRQGERDFRFLTMAVGDTPIFEPQSFLGELRLLAQRFGDPTMPPDMKKYASKATELLEHYSGQMNGGRYNAQQMQDLLKQFGKSGYGRSPMTILEGLERSDQTRIARDLFQALNKDLELAASQVSTLPVPAGTSVTNVAKLLKDARTNYATNMKAVDELGMSIIGKRMKGIKGEFSPERIAEWAHSLRPTEMSATMDILEIMRPGVRGEMARNLIEGAISKAADVASESGSHVARADLSMNTLRKHLPDEKKLTAILGPNSPAVREIMDAGDFLSRAIQRSTATANMQGNQIIGAAFRTMRHPMQSGTELAGILGPRKMAELLTDRGAVNRLRILAQAAGRRTARAQEAAAWLAQRGVPAAIIEAGASARDR